jgi:hypothetical protein
LEALLKKIEEFVHTARNSKSEINSLRVEHDITDTLVIVKNAEIK